MLRSLEHHDGHSKSLAHFVVLLVLFVCFCFWAVRPLVPLQGMLHWGLLVLPASQLFEAQSAPDRLLGV